MKKIVYAARAGLLLSMYFAFCGADGYIDILGFPKTIGLYIFLLTMMVVCAYCSELKGVHTVRRFFRRVKALYINHES